MPLCKLRRSSSTSHCQTASASEAPTPVWLLQRRATKTQDKDGGKNLEPRESQYRTKQPPPPADLVLPWLRNVTDVVRDQDWTADGEEKKKKRKEEKEYISQGVKRIYMYLQPAKRETAMHE